MSSNTKTKITVNGIQEKSQQVNIPSVLYELAVGIGLLVLFLGKLIFYYGEEIYKLINPPPPKSVKGEIVLISGTGHGIGRELALLYASEGATVVGWDINAENNNKTIKEIKDRGYPKAYSYVCDISNRDNVLEVAKKVQIEVGPVTTLINNAGIMPTRPLLEQTHTEIEKIFGINVMAHFWMLEAFLPDMIKKNHGQITCLSSMAGQIGLVNLVPYCASKFAVRGLMEALFQDLSRNPNNNIRLTTIYPFIVDTGLCKNPVVRFPNLMPIKKPREVAEEILYCQKHNIMERSVPFHLKDIVQWSKMLLPVKAGKELMDTFEAYVETDAK